MPKSTPPDSNQEPDAQNAPVKRKRGRPAKAEGRHIVKPVRWTARQWQEVRTAAAAARMSPSSFIRAAVLSQTREITRRRLRGAGDTETSKSSPEASLF